MTASQVLTISSTNGARLYVPGTFIYAGPSNTALTVLGTAFFTTLSVTSGNMIINDNVIITTARVSAGARITLIGAPNSNRTVNDVSGAGSVVIQGGTNIFHSMTNINTISLNGGVMVADQKTCTITSFTQTGGFINGIATLVIGSATLTNAVINNTPIVASYLVLNGVSTVNGASITVTGTGLVTEATQLTLGFNTSFITTPTAKISQTASLLLIPSGVLTRPPSFRNDGSWDSTRDLTINIMTSGSGSLTFERDTTLAVTGITFSMNTVNLNSSVLKSIGSNLTVNNIQAPTGSIVTQSLLFMINGVMNVGGFTHTNGNTRINRATIGNLNVTSGVFNVTGTGATDLGNLRFEGGTITSTGASKIVSARSIYIIGQDLKTLRNVTLSSADIIWRCIPMECELVLQNAVLTTG
jgi:hypothetical protein